jgi:hypothetical protein
MVLLAFEKTHSILRTFGILHQAMLVQLLLCCPRTSSRARARVVPRAAAKGTVLGTVLFHHHQLTMQRHRYPHHQLLAHHRRLGANASSVVVERLLRTADARTTHAVADVVSVRDQGSTTSIVLEAPAVVMLAAVLHPKLWHSSLWITHLN